MSQKSRRWAKIWHEVLTDQTFQDLPLEQQARYYNLLVYASCHGDNGTLKIVPPGRVFLHLLQCETYDELCVKVCHLPNVQIVKNDNAELSVTFRNWSKYQIDSTSYDRVKRHRNKRSVTPQEKEKDKEKDKEIKKIHGTFQNVLLTDKEHRKLIEIFGESGVKERIENLSEGIASKGYKYKSHYATILTWERKNKTKENPAKKDWRMT